jgi:hypothetical protein
MKLNFVLGFSGGQLHAECSTFEEADKVLDYALKRGVIQVTLPSQGGETVQAPANDRQLELPLEDATPLDEPPFDEPSEKVVVSIEDAQKAVKDYAAKHGIEAGRALLARFGFKRTSDITAEKVADIVGAANE